MTLSYSKQDIEEALLDVFQTAADKCGERFPHAIIPVATGGLGQQSGVVVDFQLQMNEMFDSVINMNRLANLIDRGHWPGKTDVEMSVRFRVQSYCHILEADLPYLLLLNLCRVSVGLPACWSFLARDRNDKVKRTKKGDVSALQTVASRLDHLETHELVHPSKIISMLRELWDNNLRNAFSHSQYLITKQGDLIAFRLMPVPEGQSGAAIVLERLNFSSARIKTLHEGASVYMAALACVYAKFMKPLYDLPEVNLGFARIKWCPEPAFQWKTIRD